MSSQSSSGPSGISSRIIPIALVAGVCVFGFDALPLQLGRNGYAAFLDEILDDPKPRFIPNSEHLLLKHYVGVAGLDRFFALSQLIWANVIDGSRPEVSLFTFCFGAQLMSFFTVLMIESKRVVGLSWLVFNPIVWGLLLQMIGFGFVMPLFLVVHLLYTSKTSWSQAVHVRDPTSLHTVVPAFLLGYLLTSVLFVYPFSEGNVRQWSCVIWTVFPLNVIVLQTLFTNIVKRTSIGQDTWTPKTKLDRAALSHAYGFAWNVAVTGQMCTYAVLIAANILPSIFPDGVAKTLTIENVFLPDAVPHSNRPMTDPASAMHNFLIYDLYGGSVATLIWAVHLLLQVRPELKSGEERAGLARGVITSILLSGPGGAVVALMQHRDDSVLTAEAKTEKSQ
ncbi:hypothetical protein FDECE_10401 [Fusarium decemcellulare]|nr:hypothetical protein FDECE_10401 [Fusarium decemcellulare]